MDKSFEALYAVSMAMADACIVNKSIDQRFSKLEEEYQEVIEAFSNYQRELNLSAEDDRLETMQKITKIELQKELSDLLFVLLHIGHQLDISAFELLHMASSKMLSRMNNPNYKPKN
jgi:NTP pyrophosphatase (non-canonical NTP hydrolase)